MLLASLSFSMMVAFVKLAGDLPTYEKVFFRSLINMSILFFWVRKQQAPLFGKRSSQPWLLGRALFGTLAMLSFFYGVNHIYLADASMLNKLNPFFVTLLAAVFLKERLSKAQVPALVVVFAASLLIIKPQFNTQLWPTLAVVGSAFFSGTAHTLLRALKNKEAPATVVFYFATVTTLLMAPLALPRFVMPQGEQWVYLLGIGVFSVTGQLSLTTAYRKSQANEIALYSFASIVFAALAGYIIWGEVSDFWTLVGGSIIVSVAIAMYFYNRNYHKKASAEAASGDKPLQTNKP